MLFLVKNNTLVVRRKRAHGPLTFVISQFSARDWLDVTLVLELLV